MQTEFLACTPNLSCDMHVDFTTLNGTHLTFVVGGKLEATAGAWVAFGMTLTGGALVTHWNINMNTSK